MARELSIEIFDECVERLAQGETIDDCLKSFPQYVDELRPMLEATRIPRRAWVSPEEVTVSQARVSVRFEEALTSSTSTAIRKIFPLRQIASLILFLLFLGSLLTTGVVVAAQDSIPGDRLYSLKLASEEVRLFLATDKIPLEEMFAKRRIDETKRVLELRREVGVQFAGIIDVVEDTTIDVAGLSIHISESIGTIDLLQGMRVGISAQARSDQTLLATDIRILDLTESNPQLIVTPSATPTATVATGIRATATELPLSSSSTPPARETTADDFPTRRPTRQPTRTPIDDSSRATSDCDRHPPSNWIRYTIQPGDTPSGIAVGTDISIEEFFEVNCELDRRMIIVGQVVFVPYAPRLQITPTELDRTPILEVTRTPRPDTRPSINDNVEHPTAVNDREDEKDSSGNGDKNQGDRRR